MPLFGDLHRKLDEILVGQANLSAKIGLFIVSTQQDAANLAQQIAAENTAWQTWATQIETAFNNVVAALQTAQQNTGVDLTDAINEANAGQQLISALPAVTDPTVAPPAPTPGS